VATSNFQRELLPPARTFYERELGKLGRPSRGWSKANCPFHASKSKTSFSVNVENGAFYCHGCGVKGDQVSFAMQRHKLSFKAAAQSLGAWRDMTTAERFQRDAEKAKRDREAEQAKVAAETEKRRRIELRDEVHTASRIWKQACARLRELRRGATPTSENEEEACWSALSLALKDLHDSDEQYCRAAGIEFTR
jgi:hypothetical protein